MASTSSVSREPSESVFLKKIPLICGILSSVLYIAMNIFVPKQWPEYSSASQTVSELSAIDAPTRAVWVPLGFIYTLLVIAFGGGVRASAYQSRPLRIAGNLLITYGIVSLAWPFAPMHLREVISTGGATLSDTMHIVLAAVTVILMLLAMGFGAAALGKKFRFYSIMTMATLFIFGALTSLDAPGINANLPTPRIGIWERINIGVFLLWIVVLAIALMREEKLRSTINGVQYGE